MPTTRHATVTTPLGDDKLNLVSMHGREELGQPFIYELTLASDDFNIQAKDLLCKSVTVHLETVDKKLRHFNGVVAHFAYAGAHGRNAAYRMTLRPWLWLLSHSVQNAVHQDVNIPDLVRSLFRQYGFTDVEPTTLSGTYDKRKFIVQYRESVFNFVSRWLEHEGIYYYFKHEDGSHKLCLADDSTSGSKVPQYEELVYRAPMQAGREQIDHFEDWRETANVIPDVYAVDGYNFEEPKLNLYESKQVPEEDSSERRIFEAPTTHLKSDVAKRYAALHGEELRAGKVTFEGSGNVRGLYPGAIFKLAEHPRDSFNTEYLVIGAEYTIHAGEFESTQGGAELQIRSSYRAIDAKIPYRPARRTPRPTVSGPETAVVVGTDGAEIHTEEYERIRVQFFWDEEHEKNEDSSCWIRLAQPWAGSDFGFQFIPRVGQEVLVDFLNGDLDQPIIIGSVYNADNKPPYTLDKHKTQSGIRTRSSKGGGKDDYNELRFEDDKGHEEVYVQAQRDLNELVKNDHTTNVKGNQTNNVVKDHTEDVKGQQKLTVKGNRTAHVEGSQSTTIDGKSAVDGISGSKLTITGDYEVAVSKTIDIQAPVSIKLHCGASTLLIEPTKISVIAGGQAVLVLDTSAYLESPSGSRLKLDSSVVAETLLGAKLALDANASLEGLQSTVTGQLSAQTISGASSLKADPSGVSVMGAPMVKIN
jgi:type VI secretion system secreted protein VgrG